MIGSSFCSGCLGRAVGLVRMRDRFKRSTKISGSDLRFLCGTDLFVAVPEEARPPLFECMAPVCVRAGERFIRQGDKADCLYLIKEGSCTAKVEQDGIIRDLARRTSGDLVGEMAIVTEKNRMAHVQAETDMTLWSISRKEFNALCRTYPGLLRFISELVIRRTADSQLILSRRVADQYRSRAMRETLNLIILVAKTGSTCLFL